MPHILNLFADKSDFCASVQDSVKEDVALLKASPLINNTTNIVGLVYDIKTGLLSEVKETESEL